GMTTSSGPANTVVNGVAICFFDDFQSPNGKIDYGEHPPEYVFRTILSQITADFHAVQQSFNQRLDIESGQSLILHHADLLSLHALAPAMKANYVDPGTTVISHFQRKTEARTIPYYEALFLSIPVMTGYLYYNAALDYLAIPHEFGHYLYWHGGVVEEVELTQPDGTQTTELKLKRFIGFMREQIAVMEAQSGELWWKHWLEEIFADLYCCLVAGPASILGMQEYLLSQNPDSFSIDTGKHPIAELRPLIQTEVLRCMTDMYGEDYPYLSYTQSPDMLDARWYHLVRERLWQVDDTYEILDTPFDVKGLDEPKSGRSIVGDLRPVIRRILEMLPDLAGTLLPWSADESDDEVLFSKFDNHVKTTLMDLPIIRTSTEESFFEKFREKAKMFSKDYYDSSVDTLILKNYEDIIFVEGWDDGGQGMH
ncbi:MAG: hypothetical protein AAF485_14170, partial [Chloroflexota bacterium]